MIKFCIFSFIFSRLFYISIIIFFYDFGIIKQYDLSNNILTKFDDSQQLSFFEKNLLNFLNYFISYDSIHFIIISKYSYLNDSIFAFYPFFPKLISAFSTILNLIFKFKNTFTSNILSGFLITNFLCFINVFLLFALTFYYTKSLIKSKICVLLFLINPGTIFYISIYSENLFFTLHIILIQYLNKVDEINSYFLQLCVILIMLLTTRSNGIILCSYFLFPCLKIILKNCKYKEIFNQQDFFYNLKKFINLIKKNIVFIGKFIILFFHSFFVYIYMTKFFPKNEICRKVFRKINENNSKYKMFYDYCHNEKYNKINNFYSYIQKEYWNVGFLKQFNINSLDRIFLSIPMNICSGYVIYKLFNYFDFKNLLYYFNLTKFLFKKKPFENYKNKIKNDNNNLEITKKANELDIVYNLYVLSGFINFLVLYLVLIFIAHPQINNRLLSGCPLLYLFLIDDILDYLEGKSKIGLFIILFFLSFSILSCLMQVGSYGFA